MSYFHVIVLFCRLVDDYRTIQNSFAKINRGNFATNEKQGHRQCLGGKRKVEIRMVENWMTHGILFSSKQK